MDHKKITNKVKKDNELRTYEDIVKFVNALPGGPPPGGIMPSHLGGWENLRPIELERALQAEDVLFIFNKYRIAVHDRKRLILAVLNVKEPK
jgi:hypothetical protein